MHRVLCAYNFSVWHLSLHNKMFLTVWLTANNTRTNLNFSLVKIRLPSLNQILFIMFKFCILPTLSCNDHCISTSSIRQYFTFNLDVVQAYIRLHCNFHPVVNSSNFIAYLVILSLHFHFPSKTILWMKPIFDGPDYYMTLKGSSIPRKRTLSGW